ncbi:hypothetical protein VNI00_015470 [Paramarasmius palmivorus]|uniref:Cytochrome P450 n=1 Tax=Paramarasmius palmivorus TaxID=297713 RepID=A0AAW0BLL3_9AGAR
MIFESIPLHLAPGLLPVLPVVLTVVYLAFQISKIAYRVTLHPLRKIPGPWFPAVSSLWIRYQRWHGKLSFTADALLPNRSQHGFDQRFDTAPKAIRALRVGNEHDWTVTYPQSDIAKPRRHPVMIACTTKNLRYWLRHFEDNQDEFLKNLGASGGRESHDIVHELRLLTLANSQVVLAGAGLDIGKYHAEFPQIVGQYNFLVVWRLVLPDFVFKWLRWGPSKFARYRVRSSDYLFDLGKEIVKQAEAAFNDVESVAMDDEPPTVYKLLKSQEKIHWTNSEISAEMAGQVFIFYEFAKHPEVQEKLFEELQTISGNDDLEKLPYLDATIKEGLRFRPPVALTGSRVVGGEGIVLMGHHIPAGMIVTTQALSITRQRPDLFPDSDTYFPDRWLEKEGYDERRKLLVPFGVGTRRCPGGNMAIYQMRLIIAGIVRAFKLKLAPETTPESMAPFEANGFRSRHDRCDLMFVPRGGPAEKEKDGMMIQI